ncbi:hypothetical protein [uncultured Winogradskyella sp.]|uniref:hypothetical protein n=1 Tax=uncultured Winogradskyella sp. TaxID=395353 RepID=UPI002613408A|nr:hypothetical protein [uncultured Winogradskyella sp.]
MKTVFLILALCFISNCNAQFISEDDGLHFGVGAVISASTYALVYSKTKNKKKAFWYSLGLSTLAGLSKELYDNNIASGRFDTGELVATFAGGLTTSYTFNIFTGKNRKKKKFAYTN